MPPLISRKSRRWWELNAPILAAAAIRLGTAAFPESGQKRLVGLLTDGNENVGDAVGAVLAAKLLGVTVDVLPMGITRDNDVSRSKKSRSPPSSKKDKLSTLKSYPVRQASIATVRLYRNDGVLWAENQWRSAGKNFLLFRNSLNEPGPYRYDVRVDAPGDPLPQTTGILLCNGSW